MHPGHTDGTTGWVVVAWLDVGQTFGEALAHRTQALGLNTLGLFPLTALPNCERLFSLPLPPVHLLISSLPQLILHELHRPLGRIYKVAQPLGSRRGLVRSPQ